MWINNHKLDCQVSAAVWRSQSAPFVGQSAILSVLSDARSLPTSSLQAPHQYGVVIQAAPDDLVAPERLLFI